MPTYKLTYFNGRGRAEVCRLLFALSDTPYEDIRVTGEEFAKIKPQTPFGQMPILEIDGKVFGQSVALFSYLAKEFGFYGQSNLDGLKIDQVVQQVSDFVGTAVKSMMEKDEAKKAELVKAFQEEEIPKHFGFFEKLLNDNNKSGFFVGNKLSLADIVVYDFVSGLNMRHPGVYDKFPQIKALVESVGNNNRIKSYVATRPVTPF